jgi:hypothetical protein
VTVILIGVMRDKWSDHFYAVTWKVMFIFFRRHCVYPYFCGGVNFFFKKKKRKRGKKKRAGRVTRSYLASSIRSTHMTHPTYGMVWRLESPNLVHEISSYVLAESMHMYGLRYSMIFV